MSTAQILVADPISARGIEEIGRDGALDVQVRIGLQPAELIEIIPAFSGLVVRSETKVTAAVLEAATKLRVVGRAGVGIDNVDVDTATRRGVIVMNAPGGNTVSTAEHAFSLLLCAARKLPQADAMVRTGKWSRKEFQGVELHNKTLGIIGMGRIGSELSRRAIAFGHARAGVSIPISPRPARARCRSSSSTISTIFSLPPTSSRSTRR
jgi:D-3-phosphoglycerate dehydrogenase